MTLLIRRMQEYLENKYGSSEPELLCRIYLRRIDHLYYKVKGVWRSHVTCGQVMKHKSNSDASVSDLASAEKPELIS